MPSGGASARQSCKRHLDEGVAIQRHEPLHRTTERGLARSPTHGFAKRNGGDEALKHRTKKRRGGLSAFAATAHKEPPRLLTARSLEGLDAHVRQRNS